MTRQEFESKEETAPARKRRIKQNILFLLSAAVLFMIAFSLESNSSFGQTVVGCYHSTSVHLVAWWNSFQGAQNH
jgi:hypothetical protein